MKLYKPRKVGAFYYSFAKISHKFRLTFSVVSGIIKNS